MTTSEYLQCYKDYDENLRQIQEYNARLIDAYPFLQPWDRRTKEIPNDYDYSYTEMDDMPAGWRIAFGDDLLNELKEELLKFDYLDKYHVLQIKEKYGTLRWYDNGHPKDCNIDGILRKYERLSEKVCIYCGKPAKYTTLDWIEFICEDCSKNFYEDELKKLDGAD